jgi:hypothetical protein
MLRPHREQRASDLLDRGVFSLWRCSRPCTVPCLRLRYRTAARPLQGHAACAPSEMTMAAATHALPALQLQQSRKLSSHTPNKHHREPARAAARGSLLALSHLVAHTCAHCAAPALVLSAVAQQPTHTLGGDPNIKTTCLAMVMVMTTSPHPTHCALDPNLPHPAAVDCGTKTSCRLAPPSPHHEPSEPASIRCCPVIRFNDSTCHRHLHVAIKLWKRKAND